LNSSIREAESPEHVYAIKHNIATMIPSVCSNSVNQLGGLSQGQPSTGHTHHTAGTAPPSDPASRHKRENKVAASRRCVGSVQGGLTNHRIPCSATSFLEGIRSAPIAVPTHLHVRYVRASDCPQVLSKGAHLDRLCTQRETHKAPRPPKSPCARINGQVAFSNSSFGFGYSKECVCSIH